MLSFFKSKPILSDEDAHFQLETFKWLLTYFGGDDFYKDTILVLPTKEHFPMQVENEEEAVTTTFNTVRRFAGLENWPCRLQAQEDDINPLVAPTLSVQNVPTNPLGTFSFSEKDEVVITYNPSLVKNPAQMVATFAHELAHYLTATAKEPPPGGWENWEFATDIAATFLGFGVFMANTSFNFRQFADFDSLGWQSSRNGYLSEAEHVYALAIFLGLKGDQAGSASLHLKPNLKKMLKSAVREVHEKGLIEQLRAVEFVGTES